MSKTIRAVVFDFDGLILDTEGPVYQSWQELFESFGCQLPFSMWANNIGTAEEPLEPFDLLEAQLGHAVDREALNPKRVQRELDLIAKQPLLPGVLETIQEARSLGLKLGLASSSSCRWVTGHLKERALLSFFDCIRCANHVERTKPYPALYHAVLAGLQVSAEEAIALEDSPNGILAAKRAGLFCVAVPNPLTRLLALDHADLQLNSLTDLPLRELITIAEKDGHLLHP